ncbi:MAG: hypothetical protein SGBAC_006479 [Bacillariaceae sp.]
MLFLACSMNPRELLDCSLFRCCWRHGSSDDDGYHYIRATRRRRRRRGVNIRSSGGGDDEEEGVDITFPTIDEYIFDSQSGEAGFVAMEDDNNDSGAAGTERRQPMTMNHVFPDLLADNGEE